MYSKNVEAVLRKKKIGIGDRVKVSKDGKFHEGFLMPRIELGDRNSVILKLDNGYNIGIEFKDLDPGMLEKIGQFYPDILKN